MEKLPTYFLKTSGLPHLLKALTKNFSVYVPLKVDDVILYNLFDPDRVQDIVLGGIHATEPLKSFFFPAHEKVATYFFTKEEEEAESKPLAIIGVKSYDLCSLKLFDLIFGEGEFLEPTYVQRRKDNLIISSDCTDYSEACFSPLVGVELYPEDNFDLSLAEVKGGLVVEVGSKKGEGIIEANNDIFSEADPEKIRERNEKRRELKEKIEKDVDEYRIDVPYEELLRNEIDSPVWKETTKSCVECGACVLVCPTCYCFLLADRTGDEGFERTRIWDACQFAGFARVAGGGNPRERLAERLRHRYLHKFDYLKESYDLYACTGCGRCIQACMGKIDMREVFVELAKAKAVK